MITIDEEVKHVIAFLSTHIGYSISMGGDVNIIPVYGTIQHWEVTWKEQEDQIVYDYHKSFFTLDEAAQFFVEKRRYLCLGTDFVDLYNSDEEEDI